MISNHIYQIPNFFSDDVLEEIRQDAQLKFEHGMFDIKSSLYAGHEAKMQPSHLVTIFQKINDVFGYHFRFKTPPRMRLATESDVSQHITPVHTDSCLNSPMQMSCIIYLNKTENNDFLNFYKGDLLGHYSYENIDESTLVKENWSICNAILYEENTAVVFPSPLFHGPSFDAGFGDSAKNGRLIIPFFYEIGYDPQFHVKNNFKPVLKKYACK